MLNLKKNQISKDHSQGAPILKQPRQPKLCHPLLLLPVISVIGVSCNMWGNYLLVLEIYYLRDLCIIYILSFFTFTFGNRRSYFHPINRA